MTQEDQARSAAIDAVEDKLSDRAFFPDHTTSWILAELAERGFTLTQTRETLPLLVVAYADDEDADPDGGAMEVARIVGPFADDATARAWAVNNAHYYDVMALQAPTTQVAA